MCTRYNGSLNAGDLTDPYNRRYPQLIGLPPCVQRRQNTRLWIENVSIIILNTQVCDSNTLTNMNCTFFMAVRFQTYRNSKETVFRQVAYDCCMFLLNLGMVFTEIRIFACHTPPCFLTLKVSLPRKLCKLPFAEAIHHTF